MWQDGTSQMLMTQGMPMPVLLSDMDLLIGAGLDGLISGVEASSAHGGGLTLGFDYSL